MSVMPALTKTDRERLTKLLGMLGSEHAGERDNAARAIERLLREHGLSWDDLLKARHLGFTVPPWPATGAILARGEVAE
jgi:hypothetical protein